MLTMRSGTGGGYGERSRIGSLCAVEVRQAVVWSLLLLVGQSTDVLTTHVDRERGALEAMPLSSQLLDQGGMALFWSTKVLLVVAAAAALLLTARWIKHHRPGAKLIFRFALIAVQAVTIGLIGVSISNVVVLASLIG